MTFQQEENDERRIERFSDSTDTDTESICGGIKSTAGSEKRRASDG